MSLWRHYHLAHSVDDALRTLTAAAGQARVIAGGTDLLLDLQQGRQRPIDTLVDVNCIPEMTGIEIDGGLLSIGAAVPLNRVMDSTLVTAHVRALYEACCLIGGPQVRNTATLGGNVAHALPAADGSIALLALGAEAEIASQTGRRRQPVMELFKGPGQSTLNPVEEILVRFLVPLCEKGQGSAFQRVMRPQGVALPVLNIGVWLACAAGEAGKHTRDLRIVIGPAGPLPFRAMKTEDALRGRPCDLASLSEAKSALLDEAHFRTSPQRATAEYRRHLSGVLLEKTICSAWERAARELEDS